ncbi:CCXG family PEP-CTERM protein [Hellea balneolensis]|uniref:CCXG family PEP-CTERM protein n=1 Tax=Hellea balneolensis TaxID=287478 RepID=UPI0009FC9037|nr:CCXG family PEP-CTERM protein [Hellea balneolensis]
MRILLNMWQYQLKSDGRKLLSNLLICMVITVFSFPYSTAKAEWAEQSCRFPHRIPVTITASATGHNTETRIDLESADFPSAYIFSPLGNDVRVFQSDDTTPVDFVVTAWDDVARRGTLYVRLPAISSGASETIYIYLGDNGLGSGSNASIVFPDIGMRLRSRISTVDPVSPADALAAFTAATVDVDNSVRPSISGLNNRAVGGTNGDYGWCVSAVLNVTPATAGVWGFRYGADFGRGGHLYVRGQELEEQWNDDLWWANNYANTAETLEGTVNLPVGWHRYEALGFEGCCDGPTGFQAMAPGGTWQDLSSANFPLRASQCVNPSATVTVSAHESCSNTLGALKTVEIDASSPSPYAIPGAIVRYDLNVINEGISVDSNTLTLTDVFPEDVALVTSAPGAFNFTDGPHISGLSFNYNGAADMTDSVEFSVDGTDFTYVPNVPTDTDVTHVRFNPSGTFNPNDAGDKPSFTISILGEVR